MDLNSIVIGLVGLGVLGLYIQYRIQVSKTRKAERNLLEASNALELVENEIDRDALKKKLEKTDADRKKALEDYHSKLNASGFTGPDADGSWRPKGGGSKPPTKL